MAPASVGNVAVGFDLIGHAIEGAADHVCITRQGPPGIRIREVKGVVTSLPSEPEKNTAAVAIDSLLDHCDPSCRDAGLELSIHKGIPLASGMGGSAASAVAAVVAFNHMLAEPLGLQQLYRSALDGESVASGSRHGDNVAPSLFGGLCMAMPDFGNADTSAGEVYPLEQVISLPVDERLHAVVVHPHRMIRTEEARSVLSASLPLNLAVRQQSLLAGFVSACYSGDHALQASCLKDLIIEPQRAVLIPDFEDIRRAAISAGALGCSISGAGPSIFAWADSPERAHTIESAMSAVLNETNTGHDGFISPVNAPGAAVTDVTGSDGIETNLWEPEN